MLREAPPHLESKVTRSGAAPAAAPVPVANLADASTQTNMEIPPINSQKSPENSEKNTENSEKSLENPGNTSNGNIEDLTPHTPPLVLPLSKEQETDLIKLIPLDDWEKWKFGWEGLTTTWGGLTPIQHLCIHLLFKIMEIQHPRGHSG